MTPPREPRTAAGRKAATRIDPYVGEGPLTLDDILAIEAEVAGAPLREALDRIRERFDNWGDGPDRDAALAILDESRVMFAEYSALTARAAATEDDGGWAADRREHRATLDAILPPGAE